MTHRMSLSVIGAVALALLLIWGAQGGTRSVEFGLAELSPRGAAGGYATPASGASTPASVSVICKLDGTQARFTWSASSDLYGHNHGITYNLELDDLSTATSPDQNQTGISARVWTGNTTPGQAYTWRVKGCSGGTCGNPIGSTFTCNALDECPAGYTLGADGFCTSSSQGGVQCATGYYCQGNDLYYRELQNNSCQSQFIQTCEYGCSGGSCLLAPAPQATLTASPLLVQRGNTTIVQWSASNVSSCTVTGTNGDSWSGASGNQTTSPITVETTYTLRCTGLDGSILEVERTVSILPVFQEV